MKTTKVPVSQIVGYLNQAGRDADQRSCLRWSRFDGETAAKVKQYEKAITKAVNNKTLPQADLARLKTALKQAKGPCCSWKKTLGLGLLLLAGTPVLSASLRPEHIISRGICPRSFSPFVNNNPEIALPPVGIQTWAMNTATDAYYEPWMLVKPDAKAIQRKGSDALKGWEQEKSSIPTENPKADAAYLEKWQLEKDQKSISPAAVLRDYIDYQWKNGYANSLSPEMLQSLLGANRDLSDRQTRELYNTIDKEVLPYAVKKMEEAGQPCLTVSKLASDIRANARIYTRQRMRNEKMANILNKRDETVYGTSTPDFSYWVGKYKRSNVTETCKTLQGGSQRTNSKFNWFTKYFG